MDDLTTLADLLRERNALDAKIAERIHRPALIGHIGEYIASAIFGIELNEAANSKDHDGSFSSGPLANCTVNIKWLTRRKNLLSLKELTSTDYYLVFTGPKSALGPAKGISLPLTIKNVYLFNAQKLNRTLTALEIKIGIAGGVPEQLWQEAEIYPVQRNTLLPLSPKQRTQLALFHPAKIGDIKI